VGKELHASRSYPGDVAAAYTPLHPGTKVIINHVGSASDEVGWLYGRTTDQQGKGWFPSSVASGRKPATLAQGKERPRIPTLRTIRASSAAALALCCWFVMSHW
jgi:hypothetical protein